MEIFAVKSNTVSEISEELLNDIFVEFDRSSPNKNFTDRSEEVKSSGWLQVDGLSAKYVAESTKKCILIR